MHSLNTNLESTHCGSQRGASSPRPGPWPRSTLGVLVLHGDRGGHQHLPEVGGEPHSREGEEGVSVDIVLRGSGEARVSTDVGVWIGAELVIADPVAFDSPVLIDFFLV